MVRQNLPSGLQDALVTTSLDGGILSWSKGARALFGYRARDLRGARFQELLPEKHQRLDEWNMQEVASGQTVRNVLVKIRDEAGETRRCLQTMLPLRDERNQVVAIQRLLFDLTKLHTVERLLLGVRAELGGIEPNARSSGRGDPQFFKERRRTLEEYLRQVQHDLTVCQQLCQAMQGLARVRELGADEAEAEFVLADG